jgi:hypothetical protein
MERPGNIPGSMQPGGVSAPAVLMQRRGVRCEDIRGILTTMRWKGPKNRRGIPRSQHQRSSVEVDIESLLLLENRCIGCARGEKSCCSSYEVCITAAEMKRIIRFLPEVARYCPHLLTAGGYDNVFEEEEHGLLTIDTNEDGLCLFAYWSHGRTQCSLHTVALTLGLPLEQVKPKVCLLWPMHFSDDNEVLAIISDAFLFTCNARKSPGSRSLSPGFIEAIERVYGDGCGMEVQQAAENGDRRTLLVPRR